MTHIHPEAGSRIRAAVPIADVVQRYLPLKKTGADDWTGLCPFHGEKTPSFKVHPNKGFYKCFGCGAAGDVLNFVQAIEHIPFPRAVETLANEFHVDIAGKPDTRSWKQKQQQQEAVSSTAAEARVFWREFGRRQWLRIRAAEAQIRKLIEWTWEYEADEEVGRQIEAAWEAAEIVIADSERQLRMLWGMNVTQLIESYVKVRTSALQSEMSKRIAGDPLRILSGHLGANHGGIHRLG